MVLLYESLWYEKFKDILGDFHCNRENTYFLPEISMCWQLSLNLDSGRVINRTREDDELRGLTTDNYFLVRFPSHIFRWNDSFLGKKKKD